MIWAGAGAGLTPAIRVRGSAAGAGCSACGDSDSGAFPDGGAAGVRVAGGTTARAAVAGGFADSNTVGFGAFYLTAAQQVTIQVFGQPSYGADGAGVLRLTLLDARRNVIATVP